MKKASLYHNFSSLTVPEKLFKVIHSLLRNKVVRAIITDLRKIKQQFLFVPPVQHFYQPFPFINSKLKRIDA